MRKILFYSWQSDLPNPSNRGFIQTALEAAAAFIAADNTVAVEPVIDRDTQGVPGSPDITATIFGKIASADVFVADISIVVRADKQRPTPNPNVLIELGYALRALGHERIILVFNKAFGELAELPFDLRTRRIMVYEMPAEASERASERKKLARSLEEAVRTALATIPLESDAEITNPAVAAIEGVTANRRVTLRRALDEILRSIMALEPTKARNGGTVDQLIAAIGQTQSVVGEFSKIADTVAIMGDEEAALDIYRWFGKLFEQFDLPPGFSGQHSSADYDFFKFVGHEMFVSLIAFLLREQRWTLLKRLLDEPIPVKNLRYEGGSTNWEYASHHLPFLLDESRKRQRISLHADLLNERHSGSGGLAAMLSIEEFMDADFFLFLLSRTLQDESGFDRHYWRAWSYIYMKQAPRFIRESTHKRVAEQVAAALGLSVDEYKVLVAKRGPEISKLFRDGWWDYPIRSDQVEQIGAR